MNHRANLTKLAILSLLITTNYAHGGDSEPNYFDSNPNNAFGQSQSEIDNNRQINNQEIIINQQKRAYDSLDFQNTQRLREDNHRTNERIYRNMDPIFRPDYLKDY